ncbi:hypothetical protein DFP72DRAFT_1150344 [Ephemerocybe angulata]|uniref:Uncharacterized protein n=1 Tax=Ephemerocybe angulata TaxID=980116 RepID=A0A8H6HI94_9AGAR|nr:hypothetical protein DFP72DRAFT_1150344 [Tulosesus angulatus]
MGTSSKARQGGRGKQRVRERVIPSYGDADRSAFEAAKSHSKAEPTLKKYGYRWDEFVEWVKQVAQAEAKKEEELRQRRARADADPSEAPPNEIDDRPIEGADKPKGPTETMDKRFPTCFEGYPTECTSVAMSMFVWDKCMVGKRLTFSTAGQVVAALIAKYDDMYTPHGYIFRGAWRYDEVLKEFRGNPGRSDRVKDVLNAVKKQKDHKERKHARAMSYEDMEAIHKHIQANLPPPHLSDAASLAKRGEYLYYSAINSELCLLKYKHLEFDAPAKRCPNGQAYERVVVNITYRKNWQRKLDSEELGLEGHIYNIYRQPRTPAIDVLTNLHAWKNFYETHLLRRSLNNEDYLFPHINFSNLTVQPCDTTKYQAINKLIKEMASKAGLPRHTTYTTHCFRRGGAQYRFMFAPVGERWTLARIRWWGGWAESEKGDTLIKYLLDELHSYEEDHSDALCPFDDTANRTHMGEDRHLRPFTAADGAKLTEHCDHTISAQFNLLRETLSKGIVEYLRLSNSRTAAVDQLRVGDHRPCNCAHERGCSVAAPTQCHSPLWTHEHAQPCAPPHYFNTPMPYHGVNAGPFPSMPSTTVDAPWQVPSASTSRHAPESQPSHATRYSVRFQPIQRRPTPDVPGSNTHEPYSGPRHCVPSVSRTAAASALDIVVADWETPQPHRCPVPLKDWRPEWYKENRQGQAYHIRKVIATEYIAQFNRDRTKFNNAYPEHVRGMTPLFKAITLARQARNEVKTRAKRTVSAASGGAMDVDADSEGGSFSPEAY